MKLKQLALRSGRWEAAVAPDFGANLTKLAYDGFPILRSPNGRRSFCQRAAMSMEIPCCCRPTGQKTEASALKAGATAFR